MTFFVKQMVLRKITFDKRVKNIPQSEQTKERDIYPNTMKNCKRQKNVSQSIWKSLLKMS